MVGRDTPGGATEGAVEKTTGSLGSAREGSLRQSPHEPTLAKIGGVIRGNGQKFWVNPATGTG